MKTLSKTILIFLIFAVKLNSLSAQTQNEFACSGIAVGVVAEDLHKSLDFYTKVIGMVEILELSIDIEKAHRMGLSNGSSFDIKVLQ